MPGRQRWPGWFLLDVGRALYVGPTAASHRHAHHAIQICVGLAGPLRVRTAAGAAWTRHHGCLITPEQPHELDAGGSPAALLYLEPESRDGRRVVLAGTAAGIAPLSPALVGALRALLARDSHARPAARDAQRVLDATVALLGQPTAITSAIDARIVKALQRLRASGSEYPSSAELAGHVGLSAGRFRHLWRTHMGLAYRRYLLWLRLQAAIAAVVRRSSLTTAAHASGFADSAHLTRTFRRMLGIAPSAMPAIMRVEANR